MLSQNCLKRLTEYLLKIDEKEKIHEVVRQSIGKNSYFQVETAFARMDKFGKGYLTPSDFSEFMLENGIYPTDDELYLIFRDFDKGRTGHVTIDDFEEEIVPKENAQLRKDILSRKFYPPDVRLEEDLEEQIARYFKAKMDSFLAFNKIRVQLLSDPTFTVSNAFLILYSSNRGTIQTKEDIDRFLRKNGKALKCEELRRIYECLDFRLAGPINFYRFCDHLDPLSRGYYPGYSLKIVEREEAKKAHLHHSHYIAGLREDRVRNELYRTAVGENLLRLREQNDNMERLLYEQELYKRVLGFRNAELESRLISSRLAASEILQRELRYF